MQGRLTDCVPDGCTVCHYPGYGSCSGQSQLFSASPLFIKSILHCNSMLKMLSLSHGLNILDFYGTNSLFYIDNIIPGCPLYCAQFLYFFVGWFHSFGPKSWRGFEMFFVCSRSIQ